MLASGKRTLWTIAMVLLAALTVANSQARQGADSVKRVERPNTRAPAFVPRLGKREQQQQRQVASAAANDNNPFLRPNLLCSIYGLECGPPRLSAVEGLLLANQLTSTANQMEPDWAQADALAAVANEVEEDRTTTTPVAEQLALLDLMAQRMKRQELFNVVSRANRVPFTPRIG